MQKVTIFICFIVSIITLSSTSVFSANDKPAAQWKFYEGKGSVNILEFHFMRIFRNSIIKQNRSRNRLFSDFQAVLG